MGFCFMVCVFSMLVRMILVKGFFMFWERGGIDSENGFYYFCRSFFSVILGMGFIRLRRCSLEGMVGFRVIFVVVFVLVLGYVV